MEEFDERSPQFRPLAEAQENIPAFRCRRRTDEPDFQRFAGGRAGRAGSRSDGAPMRHDAHLAGPLRIGTGKDAGGGGRGGQDVQASPQAFQKGPHGRIVGVVPAAATRALVRRGGRRSAELPVVPQQIVLAANRVVVVDVQPHRRRNRRQEIREHVQGVVLDVVQLDFQQAAGRAPPGREPVGQLRRGDEPAPFSGGHHAPVSRQPRIRLPAPPRPEREHANGG